MHGKPVVLAKHGAYYSGLDIVGVCGAGYGQAALVLGIADLKKHAVFPEFPAPKIENRAEIKVGI